MDMEHIRAIFFHPSLLSVVMCVIVLNNKNTPCMTICTCAVLQGLLYVSVSADIIETVRVYQGHALVLTPVP